MNTSTLPSSGPLGEFVNAHRDKVIGVLHGFDRVRVQATLRTLYSQSVMAYYLLSQKLLFKDFKGLVTRTTEKVRKAASDLAERLGRPQLYLRSNCYHKEDLAREMLAKSPVKEGLIGVISAVEPCRTWFARGNKETKHLELQMHWGKCVHLYFYFLHQQLGFLHVRLQTWFPFLVQICFNGREWLSRQMDAAGLKYERRDNCFPWIQDVGRAQALMDQQSQVNWQELFCPLVDVCHPHHGEIGQPIGASYYWTVSESEYATDVMFKSRSELERIYPRLVHHSVMRFGSEQVLRFFSRQNGQAVNTDRRRGEDGVRVKHWRNDNSLKLYDKGSVLRSEVTINNVRDFRAWRASELNPEGDKQWRIMRRTVADVPRRAEVCRAACGRHFQALAAVEEKTPLGRPASKLCRARKKEGRRYRALRPFGEDLPLLQAINRGEWTLCGFRNADLRKILFPKSRGGKLRKKHAAAVSRKLALLRVHGLIRRVPKRHLYHVTAKGRAAVTALLAAQQANIEELTKMAA
jgi:hypothetical protein